MKQQNENAKYWRSLEQLENKPEFEQFLRREFPDAAEEAPTGVNRRRWIQLMGASLALGAGAAGCRYPEEAIAPFAKRPENRIPGKPEKFATTLNIAGKVCPVVATSYDGRPIKVDGNKQHPLVSGSDTLAQAVILNLYDPDRSRSVQHRTDEASSPSWESFQAYWEKQSKTLSGNASSKLAILHQSNASPSVAAQMDAVAEKFPNAKWYQYQSVAGNNDAAAEKAFGKTLNAVPHLETADILVSIDCDLLGANEFSGINSKHFGARRVPENGKLNRLYAIESQYSTTGLSADHRLAVRTSKMPSLVADLEARIDAALKDGPTEEKPEGKPEIYVTALVNDLVTNQGHSLVLGGDHLDVETLARIWRINEKLKNIGKTVTLHEPPQLEKHEDGTITELAQALKSGEVDTLIILDGNPVYDAPADASFAEAVAQAKTAIYYGDYENETSLVCGWHLPASHGLEQWGDAYSKDGTYCIAQPLIEPIFDGRNLVEVLSLLAGSPVSDTLSAVKATAQSIFGAKLSEHAWAKLVHDGFAEKSASKPAEASLASELELPEVDAETWKETNEEALEVVFQAGSLHDGRYANNGWLQELPHPITKVTWDNVLTISPATATQLDVSQGELVAVTVGSETVEIPAFIQPGQAHGTLGVALGYGRPHAGMVGGNVDENVNPVGVDVGPLRKTTAMHVTTDVDARSTGKRYLLACTQDHFAIDALGRDEIDRRRDELVREAPVSEYQENHDFVENRVPHQPESELWPDQPWQSPSYEGHAWGMSIDLTKCTGCNACTIACQAENNVPIVGKQAVSVGREMHWIRIDRYFSGDMEDPTAVSQPVTCHHCETAPCESVCPVAATVHSDEGLNDMVYNRCIGTRYCGNNCPFKVRRFNYLDWRGSDHRFEEANKELAKLIFNPEVTVRNRGVMEKCTYCVQRIQNTKIESRAERRSIGANEIKVACQEACAAEAIEFGDLHNDENLAAQAHKNPRAYEMLEVLKLKARTKYLAKIRNPHAWMPMEEPKMYESHEHGGEHAHGEHDGEHSPEEHAKDHGPESGDADDQTSADKPKAESH